MAPSSPTVSSQLNPAGAAQMPAGTPGVSSSSALPSSSAGATAGTATPQSGGSTPPASVAGPAGAASQGPNPPSNSSAVTQSPQPSSVDCTGNCVNGVKSTGNTHSQQRELEQRSGCGTVPDLSVAEPEQRAGRGRQYGCDNEQSGLHHERHRAPSQPVEPLPAPLCQDRWRAPICHFPRSKWRVKPW